MSPARCNRGRGSIFRQRGWRGLVHRRRRGCLVHCGAAATLSGTFTRHLLQNLSPGLIGLPHALQTRISPAGATGAGAAYSGAGAGAVRRRGCLVHRRRRLICLPCRAGSTAGTAEFHIRCHGRAAGCTDECRRPGCHVRRWCLIHRCRHRHCHRCRSRGSSSGCHNFPALCPADPAELLIGCEQCTAGKTAKVRGRGGGGAATAGDSSMSDAPQERQNFCEMPTFLPHSGQNGIG